MWTGAPEAGINDRNKQLHPTDTVGVITHPCPWYLHASGEQFPLWNQYMK